MQLATCNKGHFYDKDIHFECPHCNHIEDVNLPEKYKIISLLSKGGAGRSVLVWDLSTESNKVIKIIDNPELWDRIETQEELLQSLNCDYIINTYAVKRSGEQGYIEQEYIVGDTIDCFVQQSSLLLEDFLNITNSVFYAIDYLSKRGLSHKDIKPSNLIYNRESGIAKIIDIDYLGIMYSSGKGYLGTVKYSSPEQIMENKFSVEADIYSFGLVMCFMILGEIPFDVDPIKLNNELRTKLIIKLQKNKDIDEIIRAKIISLISSCLKFAPKDRIALKDAIVEIQEIKQLSFEKKQDKVVLHQILNDLILQPDDKTDKTVDDFEHSVMMISENIFEKAGEAVDILPEEVKKFRDDENFVAAYNGYQENKNIYRHQLLKEYDNILFQAKMSFVLWVISFIIFFSIIAVSIITILQANYIEGLLTVILDGFILGVQKLFNIREDHYRELIEQKMKHLETGDYLDYAFEKIEKLDNQQDRNNISIEMIKAVREQAMKVESRK